MLRRDCPTGAKLFPRCVVSSDLHRSYTLRRNCTAGAKSPAGTLFQWNLEGWLNRRVDLNQAIDLTLQVDSTIGLNRPSGLI